MSKQTRRAKKTAAKQAPKKTTDASKRGAKKTTAKKATPAVDDTAVKQVDREAKRAQDKADKKAARDAAKNTHEALAAKAARDDERKAKRAAENKAKADARAVAKQAKVAERERLAADKRRNIEETRGASRSSDTDRSWVDAIRDPRQRALARVIPDICAIFGIDPIDMVGRKCATDPRGMVIGSNHKACHGAVVYLGRELGVQWNALHGRTATKGQSGDTEIRDLIDAHRMTQQSFRMQFAALAGLPVETKDGITAPPIGEIGHLVRARFAAIRARAFADLGMAYATPAEDDGREAAAE